MVKTPVDKLELWRPARYTKEQHRAIQAIAEVAAGKRDEPLTQLECKTALDWIVTGASMTYDNGFEPADPAGRIGAFVDGRQSVGQAIVKLINTKVEISNE